MQRDGERSSSSNHELMGAELTGEESARVETASVTQYNSLPNRCAHSSDLDKNKGDVEKQPHDAGAAKPTDSGRDAWLTVLGGWCGFFVSFGWMNSVGVFQEYYEQHPLAAYTPSAVAWIPSTEIFFLFAGGAVCGKIFDSYGPRYLLLVGALLHIFGLMMASLGNTYYQFFLAQSVCSSAGASAVFYASMNAVSTWFLKRRATAMGIVASGSSLGGVVLPIMVTHLLPQLGFGWTMRAVAFLMLGLLVIANLTVRSRLTHVPKRLSLVEFAKPLREPPFLIFTAASSVFFWGTFIPFNFLILQGESQGISPEISNYLIPVLNAASLFGRIIPGYLADRMGRYNMMIITTAVSAILTLTLWLPGRGVAAELVFAALFGFFSGAFVSLGPSVVAQISPISEIGLRNGTVYAFVALAALTGNPIGGALVTHENGAFWGLQVFCGVCMAVGSALFLASRAAKVGMTVSIY